MNLLCVLQSVSSQTYVRTCTYICIQMHPGYMTSPLPDVTMKTIIKCVQVATSDFSINLRVQDIGHVAVVAHCVGVLLAPQ